MVCYESYSVYRYLGTLMTWALVFGLVSGAICAYGFVPLTTIIEDDQFCTSTNMTNTFIFSSCTNLTAS